MTDDSDITLWLNRLAQRNEVAVQRIWEQYCQRLYNLARKKLGNSPRRVADEEDVALSAFNSFCNAAANGRLPQLNDRDDLWRILVTITARKAMAQHRQSHAQKRGGGHVRGESVFISPDGEDFRGIEAVLGEEPTPELAADVSEQVELLLRELDDESLKTVTLLKLEGYTNVEIASKLDCAVTTIERKLARIRKKWEGKVVR
jgi:RNA polymerase sigma factor (sigma-70 family)